MRIRNALALLLFLIPLSALDNTLAAATPDPHDDLLAAANDEFQPTLRQREWQRSLVRDLPVPDGLPARPTGLTPPLPSPHAHVWTAAPPLATPCLYV